MTLCLSKIKFPSHTLTADSTSTERLQKIGPELKGMKSVEISRGLNNVRFILSM
jgi:hypothetical protein